MTFLPRGLKVVKAASSPYYCKSLSQILYYVAVIATSQQKVMFSEAQPLYSRLIIPSSAILIPEIGRVHFTVDPITIVSCGDGFEHW